MEYKQIVVYDVPQEHDPLRTKIVSVLEDFGLERFQYSVFGGNLSKEQVENLVVVLKRLKSASKADIRIFLLRSSSSANPAVLTVSEAKPPHPATKATQHPQEKEVVVF